MCLPTTRRPTLGLHEIGTSAPTSKGYDSFDGVFWQYLSHPILPEDSWTTRVLAVLRRIWLAHPDFGKILPDRSTSTGDSLPSPDYSTGIQENSFSTGHFYLIVVARLKKESEISPTVFVIWEQFALQSFYTYLQNTISWYLSSSKHGTRKEKNMALAEQEHRRGTYQNIAWSSSGTSVLTLRCISMVPLHL